jgi:hypothetical protein
LSARAAGPSGACDEFGLESITLPSAKYLVLHPPSR